MYRDFTRGAWTAEEDATLAGLVQTLGARKWSEIAKRMPGADKGAFLSFHCIAPIPGSLSLSPCVSVCVWPGRIGKQCRERWHNHLNPNVKKEQVRQPSFWCPDVRLVACVCVVCIVLCGQWSEEEDVHLMELHARLGNKWYGRHTHSHVCVMDPCVCVCVCVPRSGIPQGRDIASLRRAHRQQCQEQMEQHTQVTTHPHKDAHDSSFAHPRVRRCRRKVASLFNDPDNPKHSRVCPSIQTAIQSIQSIQTDISCARVCVCLISIIVRRYLSAGAA